MFPISASSDPDARLPAYGTGVSIRVLDLNSSGDPVWFRTDGNLNVGPALSHDGRLIAYLSGKNGQFQIVVAQRESNRESSLDNVSGPSFPLWSPAGNDELFLQSDSGEIWVVTFDRQDFKFGKRELLVPGIFLGSDNAGLSYGVSQDGQRVLLVRLKQRIDQFSEFVVRYDWFDELDRLVRRPR